MNQDLNYRNTHCNLINFDKKRYKLKVIKAKIVSDNCQFYLQIKTNPSMHTVLGK